MHRLVGQVYMGPDETLWWIWSTWSIIFLPRLSPSPIYSVFLPGRKRFLTYQEANLTPFSTVESTVYINLAYLVVQGQKHQRAISKQRHFVNKTQQMMEPKISDLNCHCSEIARSGGSMTVVVEWSACWQLKQEVMELIPSIAVILIFLSAMTPDKQTVRVHMLYCLPIPHIIENTTL